MRNIERSGLFFGLIVCLCCCIGDELFCSNGVGYCDDFNSYISCYINNSDTQLAKELLKDCSNRSTDYTRLLAYKDYISGDSENLRIDIELPSNIQSLEIRNYKDDDHIRITTFIENTALTHIYISAHIELETEDVLDYFTNLKSLQLEYLLSREPPSFKKLQYLNYLSIRLVGPETHAFDDTIVSGLSRLIVLSLYSSYFHGITIGAFRNLNQLTHLDIGDNKITYIEDDVFTDLINLRKLDLSKNGLSRVSNNAFEGLSKLTYLSVSQNPGFPINVLLQTRNLERIYLYYNEYQTLDPYVFQQMKSLTYLGLSDPFRCDCMLRWTSILWQYGITIGWAPYCFQPSIFQQKYIFNPSVYSNCSQTQMYQCFNKLITCPGNLVCHNTNDSYTCDCPIGYEQNVQGNCIDTNECNTESNCEPHSCVNTEGSYYCMCDKGYKLASNGYDCDDVNECHEWNGGCEHGCGNTIGSYQCYCENGYSLKNETHCEEGIECELIEGNYTNTQLGSYSCKGGYNLMISGFSLTNVQTADDTESDTTLLVVTLMGMALLMNVVLVIVIIALSTCIFQKNRKKGPENPKVESLYDSIDESTIPGNSKLQIPADISVDHNYQNYPGRAKEDNVEYINVN